MCAISNERGSSRKYKPGGEVPGITSKIPNSNFLNFVARSMCCSTTHEKRNKLRKQFAGTYSKAANIVHISLSEAMQKVSYLDRGGGAGPSPGWRWLRLVLVRFLNGPSFNKYTVA
jgi:hypothetical protein